MQFPVQPAKIISTEGLQAFMIWVASYDDDCTFLDIIDSNRDIPIYVSDGLMKDVLQKTNSNEKIISLQVADIKQSIAWWSRGHVKSNLISFAFVRHDRFGKIEYITSLDVPVNMTFYLKNSQQNLFTSTVTQLNSNLDPLILDLNVKVFRLDLPCATVTEIIFLYPPTTDELRVLVLKHFRPDMEFMTKKAAIVNETTSLIRIDTFEYDNQINHYLGILPGSEVPVSRVLNFTFEVSTFNCQLWNRGWWKGRGSNFKNNSANSTVTCYSKHLSVFSVGMPIPPYSFEPYAELTMFLNVHENYLIILVTSVLILAYLLASIWAVRKDFKDKFLRLVTILDDNYPNDRNPYLVSVWTSSRLNAGTTAHVAIQLHGEDSVSRVHILSSRFYRVLKRNTDNWFIILSPRPLGHIFLARIWHDNYGSSPEWYCDKICVYDLQNKVEYLFPIGQWVALRLEEYSEVAVLPAYIEDLKNKKRTFIECLKYDTREGHLMMSIILRHARSYMTRLQRITILMSCVMIAIAWSVFFFVSISHPGVDDWNTDIATREVLVSLQILAINVVFIMLVTFAFRKSAKFTYDRFASTLIIRAESTGTLAARKSTNAPKLSLNVVQGFETVQYKDVYGTSLFSKFLRSLYTIRRPDTKLPVHLPEHKVAVGVRMRWYLVAWLLSTTIIALSVIFIFFWSLKIEYNQSQKCIFCAFLGIIEEVLIFSPVEILLFSLLFAIGFKTITEPLPHNINKNDLKSYYKRAVDDKEHYYKILEMRSLPMYRPIRVSEREQHLIKRFKRYQWSKVIDFLLILIFVIAVSSLILRMWTSQYYTNHHTEQILNLGHSKIGTIDFFLINDTSGMNKYLQGTFIRAVYLLRWYNGQVVATRYEELDSHSYRMSDATRKMIGKPLIRQLRVRPTTCNHFMGRSDKKCIPPYSLENEDQTDYGVGWTAGKWSEPGEEYSPWQYKDRSINWVFKQFSCYGGMRKELNYGGYMAHLSPYRFESFVMAAELEEQSWLNHLTRAVILEITIYSVNENLLSHETLFLEFPDAFQSVRRIQVVTVPGSKDFHVLDFIFIMLVVYFTVTAIRSINQHGLFQYISEKENILNVLIIMLSTVVVLLLIVHFLQAKMYLSKIESIAQTGHFDFDGFVYNFRMASVFISLLTFIVFLQLIFLLKAGRYITLCYYAFIQSLRNSVIIVSILAAIIIVQWRLSGFFMNMYMYHSILQTIMKSFNSQTFHNSRATMVEVNFLITHLCIKITAVLLVMIFLHYITVARTKVVDSFNFITFLLTELKDFIKGVKAKQYLNR